MRVLELITVWIFIYENFEILAYICAKNTKTLKENDISKPTLPTKFMLDWTTVFETDNMVVMLVQVPPTPPPRPPPL